MTADIQSTSLADADLYFKPDDDGTEGGGFMPRPPEDKDLFCDLVNILAGVCLCGGAPHTYIDMRDEINLLAGRLNSAQLMLTRATSLSDLRDARRERHTWLREFLHQIDLADSAMSLEERSRLRERIMDAIAENLRRALADGDLRSGAEARAAQA